MDSMEARLPSEDDSSQNFEDNGSLRLPRELRRQQLILSALRVFSTQGYHATTMNHIASAADITKPVLYQHFKSKRDLYLAVLDQQITDLLEHLVKPLHESTDNQQRVEDTLAAFFGFIRSNPQGYRLVFQSDIQNDPVIMDRVEHLLLVVAEHISKVLRPGAGLAQEDALLFSRSLTGMVLAAVKHALLRPNSNDHDLQRVEKLVFMLAWHGISQLDEAMQNELELPGKAN